jgi:outer membrane protein
VASRNYNDSDGGFQSGKTTTDAVGVQLNLPLFSGLGTSARTDQAHALFLQAQEQLKGTERSTERDTRSAYLGVESSISQVQALQQAVISNQASVDATEAGFRVGTRTSLDVLTAISELFNAKSEYAQSRYTYLLNTLQLKNAAGTLGVTDLTQINGYLSSQPRNIGAGQTSLTPMPDMGQGDMKQ